MCMYTKNILWTCVNSKNLSAIQLIFANNENLALGCGWLKRTIIDRNWYSNNVLVLLSCQRIQGERKVLSFVSILTNRTLFNSECVSVWHLCYLEENQLVCCSLKITDRNRWQQSTKYNDLTLVPSKLISYRRGEFDRKNSSKVLNNCPRSDFWPTEGMLEYTHIIQFILEKQARSALSN